MTERLKKTNVLQSLQIPFWSVFVSLMENHVIAFTWNLSVTPSFAK